MIMAKTMIYDHGKSNYRNLEIIFKINMSGTLNWQISHENFDSGL